MSSLVTDALVLHAFDYLETSRILRLATREAGLLSVIARGARKSVKRFGSAMDLFVGGIAEIEHKPGRELHPLVSFEVTAGRGPLAEDIDRFMSSSMLAELALRAMGESDHGGLFDGLSQALDGLANWRGQDARVEGIAAAWRVVATLGFAPSLDGCASCHQPLSDQDDAQFSFDAGGAVCHACARTAPGGRRLPAAARGHLRSWLAGASIHALDRGMQRAHVRLLREFVQRHLTESAELRAFAAWADRFEAGVAVA